MGQTYENLVIATTLTFAVQGPGRAEVEKKVWERLDAYAPGAKWDVDLQVKRQDGAVIAYATATMIDG